MPEKRRFLNLRLTLGILFIVTFLVVFGTACEEFIDSGYRFEEPFSKTIALKEAGSFSLDNVNGSITITTSPAMEVSIKATKYARWRKTDLGKVRIEVVQGEKSVKIDTIYEKRNLGAKVDYEITVPEGTALELVKTVNGRITVSGKFEKAELRSTNGHIEARGEFGWLEASTTNGSLEVAQVKGRLDLQTTNGNIKAELNELTADFRARTTNGSIKIAFRDKPNAYLTARTVNGSIRVEYPLTVEGQISRRRIEGRLGNGQGPRLDLQTTNGSISLLKF